MKWDDDSWLAMVVGVMFRTAWPIWKAYQGHVPDEALRQLEERADWPRGLADTIMQRIGRYRDLRKQLEER